MEIAGRRAPQQVVSDGTWRSTDAGPIRYADILDGEVARRCANRRCPGRRGIDAAPFRRFPAVAAGSSAGGRTRRVPAALVWQRNEPIRVVKELPAVKLSEPKPGVYVFDLGQNMVGWCRLKLRGPAGTQVVLHHAERLNDDGTVYTANLRGRRRWTSASCAAGGEEVFEPKFTYHGFRYVQVTGLPAPPKLGDLTGRVIASSSPLAYRFECSNPLVNQLVHNIEWTQRANMYSVPTDCPQRDERLGWMGDIQAFSQTAIFNMDMAGFFSKWVPDVRDAQMPDGRFSDFSPHPIYRNTRFYGVPAWGDAGIVVPWRMYVNYADRRVLEEHFDSAASGSSSSTRTTPTCSGATTAATTTATGSTATRWCLTGYPKGISAVPKELLATAFFAHSTEIVAKMAAVLGRADEAAKYGKLFDEIKTAFRREFVGADGRIKGDTQAGYALALHFNLLDEACGPRRSPTCSRPSTATRTTPRPASRPRTA